MKWAQVLWRNMYTFCLDCMLRIECKVIQHAEFCTLPIVHDCRLLERDLEVFFCTLNVSKWPTPLAMQ